MSARNQQQQIGEGELTIGQPGRERVAFEVVHRQQRLARGHRQRLGTDEAHHHPADQPRPGCRGDGVEIIECHARFTHHLFEHGREPLSMGARGDFGDDPAIGRVFGLLTGDCLRDNRPVTAHQRHGGLVAARFDAED